jgi:hypothetical protein
MWRVGLGSKVQIWCDPWINRAPSRKLDTQRGRARIRWVSQLIILGRREWDVPLLHSIFHRHDVEEILKIRLSDRLQDDFIA